jgi:DNA topoisomerase-1
MPKNLVIVESPTKAKILTRFLGKDFVVKSSYGHIRDLPSKKSDLPAAQQKLPHASLAIDIENNFEPIYVISGARAKKTVADLKKNFDGETALWIATDEDREGEAIGWHLLEILKPKKSQKVRRIVFHEITKTAILKAIETPREIDDKMVAAQKARRILDRIVGWELSPLLWKVIRFGLSAGRVQSAAVKIIVDREREIKKFIPEESWSIVANCEKEKVKFSANFTKLDGKKFVPKNKDEAEAILSATKSKDFTVEKIDEKETTRRPYAPFITSTLQQEAARKLHFSVKKTMTVAQKLYEGDGKSAGLITYMRTDSTNLSQKAIFDARAEIAKKFGKNFLPENSRVFSKKSKGAQEAHEAIRPTEISATPEGLKKILEPDQFKLYELIWKRTVACQMADAKMKNTAVDFLVENSAGKKYTFHATGQTVAFAGFLKLYFEDLDDENESANPVEKLLPNFKIGEKLRPKKLEKKQHFTKPPARYTEASLVKKLESEGIGRPSTYAPTITTVQSRGYVEKEGRNLAPTDTAFVVTELLEKHFEKIVDAKFTAKMENSLDEIAAGKLDEIEFLKKFYGPFHDLISKKSGEIKKQDLTEETDEICEKCGAKMVIKLSRFGKFLSCSKYPECKNARPLERDEEKEKEMEILAEEFKNEKCEKCGAAMIVKSGRFGNFLACSKYPDCKNTKPILKTIGMKCPACGKGEVVEKRTKRGKIFYGCERYPKCDFASWKDPREKEE